VDILVLNTVVLLAVFRTVVRPFLHGSLLLLAEHRIWQWSSWSWRGNVLVDEGDSSSLCSPLSRIYCVCVTVLSRYISTRVICFTIWRRVRSESGLSGIFGFVVCYFKQTVENSSTPMDWWWTYIWVASSCFKWHAVLNSTSSNNSQISTVFFHILDFLTFCA